MTRYLLSIVGIIGSFYLVKYREVIGNSLGEPAWMRSFGGIYTFLVFIAIFIFFWSLATITNSTDILLAPVKMIFPIQASSSSF